MPWSWSCMLLISLISFGKNAYMNPDNKLWLKSLRMLWKHLYILLKQIKLHLYRKPSPVINIKRSNCYFKYNRKTVLFLRSPFTFLNRAAFNNGEPHEKYKTRHETSYCTLTYSYLSCIPHIMLPVPNVRKPDFYRNHCSPHALHIYIFPASLRLGILFNYCIVLNWQHVKSKELFQFCSYSNKQHSIPCKVVFCIFVSFVLHRRWLLSMLR